MEKIPVCAITGHRFSSLPFGSNESDPLCQALREALREHFTELITHHGTREFRCGMALGSDQIAAEIIITLKRVYPSILLHCFVPCREQYLKWSKTQIACYRNILQFADEITQTSETYTKGCMQKRNRKMLEGADILLAVYIDKKRGGTKQTIDYAQKTGIPTILLDPTKI